MLTEEYKVKKISFEDYDKFFKDLIASPDDHHILFYKRNSEKFIISLSYDQFIIITEKTIAKLIEEFQAASTIGGQPYEVAMDETGDHPAVIKFMAEYLKRGIPEVD